jgi:hypothetical protein
MTHSRLSALPSRMALLALAGMLALAGCNQRHDTVSMEPAPPPAPMAGGAGMKQSRAANVQAEDAAAAAPAQDEMAQRFLAVRQELNVEVPQAQLADAWGQVRDLCATLRCELLTATLLRETPQQPGNALLEIQRTLSDTQAELDAMAAQRKLLEQQTSKQHIQIQFTPTRALVQGGTSYSPIGRALRDAGHVLGESMGALITFVAAVLPWLVLVVLPLGWMLRALWRRRRARRG